MEIVLITYESELDVTAVEDLFRDRAGTYREMDGLIQKFYLHDEASGRVGGIYVFDSEASRDALFDSDVHATLRDAYATRGDLDVSTFHVLFPLHTSVEFPASA